METQYIILKTLLDMFSNRLTKQKRELFNWKTDHKKSLKMQHGEKERKRKYERQNREGQRLI